MDRPSVRPITTDQVRNDRNQSLDYRFVKIERSSFKVTQAPWYVRFQRSPKEAYSIPYSDLRYMLDGDLLTARHSYGIITIRGRHLDLLLNELEALRVLAIFQAPENDLWAAESLPEPIPEEIEFLHNP